MLKSLFNPLFNLIKSNFSSFMRTFYFFVTIFGAYLFGYSMIELVVYLSELAIWPLLLQLIVSFATLTAGVVGAVTFDSDK